MSETQRDFRGPISHTRLKELREAAGAGPVLLLTHDNPDPDALASGAEIAYLFDKAWGIPVYLGYSGLIARAENKAMLEVLTPDWKPIEAFADLKQEVVWALVDTQPGAGNNSLPPDILPRIVIDHHHPIRPELKAVKFVDIRNEFGATSSMVYQYLEAAGIEPDPLLATAIFYGIQTDTQSLSRGGSLVDQEIYLKLIERIDREMLVLVLQAGLPREYYQAFSDGLKSTRIFGKAVVSYLGPLHRPDFVAELADSLIRLEGTSAALCMGCHDGLMYISLRTPSSEVDAGRLIQGIVAPRGKAGGHGTIAGGQIPVGKYSPDEIAAQVERKFLKLMKEGGKGEQLLT